MNSDSILGKCRAAFSRSGKIDIVIILLFLAINGLVLTNSILQHPKIGYDATGNINYIQILLHRLPTPQDSNEFFSPPLPYFLPSVYDAICNRVVPAPLENLHGVYVIWICRTYDGKFAQYLNFGLSIGTTLLLLLIAEQIKPGNGVFKISLLLLLALLTVDYKTFSQVRAEPYVVFFAALSIYLLGELFKRTTFDLKIAVLLGLSLGLLVLSRQWGFFLFPAMGLLVLLVFWRDRPAALRQAAMISIGCLVGALLGGWFYLHLYLDYGSFTKFNQESKGFSLSNLPPMYFRATGLKGWELFKDPVRPTFDATFFPVFYSDTWGDYWGYFTYHNPDSDFGDNSRTVVPYLGRVNLFAILPSLLLLAGWIHGSVHWVRRKFPLTPGDLSMALVLLIAIVSFAGYLWFVISYYPSDDSVNKAAYIIQMFIALLFPAAGLLEAIEGRSRWIFGLISLALVIVFVHNLPALITNYRMF